MRELKVGMVVYNKQEDSENFEEFKRITNEKNIKLFDVVEKYVLPYKINIEKNLYFEILWPKKNKLNSENILNNNSLVCKLNYKDFSCLFTGDIEKTAENKILQEYKNNLSILNSTTLKVAHHGSNTSSIKDFIDTVNPKIALIGVQENNKFGHPNIEVLERLESLETNIYRTDKMGEITIIVNSKGKIKVKKFLKQEK